MSHQPFPSDKSRAPFAEAAYAAADESKSSVESLRGEVRAELRALRTSVSRFATVRDVGAQIEQLQRAVAELRPPPPKTRAVSALLERAGIEGRAATTLRTAVARAMRERKSDELTLEDAWHEALCESIGVTAWPLATSQPSAVALVGPSGVGKTTTSAKLAARFIESGRTVTLVACDHFRVGAAHQLRRYADLMGARYAKATNESELEEVVAAATTNVVILDTAGTMPVDASIARVMARTDRSTATLLCMAACVRAADATHISEAFAAARATALCITKIDETPSPAGLLHARVASSLPVAALCNGPRVPDDIAPATSAAIVDALRSAARRAA